MRNSDLIDHIFSEALNQLRRDWHGDSISSGEAVPPPADAEKLPAEPLPDRAVAPNLPDETAPPELPAEVPDISADSLPPEADTGDDRKENMVALKPNKNDDSIPDLPPEISSAAGSEEDDLDSLLEDLANSADPDKADGADFSNLFADEKGDGHYQALGQEDAGLDATGHSLDDLLEHALGLDDTPDDEEDGEDETDAVGDISGFESDDEDDESGDGAEEDQPDAGMIEPSFASGGEEESDADDLSALLGSASDLIGDGGEDEMPLSDDLFQTADEEDAASGLGALLGGDETEDDAESDIVQTVKVPEPSVPLSEEADEELERQLAEMGLGGDNLLHNRFSASKEKLLHHLLARFEALARQKLEPLPNDQANMVRSVNLRVEIDLKFGEFTTSGNDDSLFQLEV